MNIPCFLFAFYFVLLFNSPFQPHSKEIDWLTDYEKAVKISKKSNKNILLYFTGSDWCSPCKSLKKDLFETEEFRELSDNYVLLYIDIPRNQDLISKKQQEHNKEIMQKYNRKNVFPLLKVLNKKGKSLDEISGYSMNGEISFHLDLLKRNR